MAWPRDFRELTVRLNRVSGSLAQVSAGPFWEKL